MPEKLIVGFPLYRQIPSEVFSNWLAIDHSPMVATVTIETPYICSSMDTIVSEALASESEWDRLVIFEQDMVPPKDGLLRMAHYPPGADIVGSMYFQHTAPCNCHVFIEDLTHEGSYSPITPQTVKEWTDDPCLHRCGAVGFGFTGISRHVLKAWDHDKYPMFATGIDGLGSHDLYFCDRARKQGHSIYVDSGLVCGHLSNISVGLEDNQRYAHMIDGEEILDFEYPGA
jgi:hypothetical protein